MTVLVKSDCPRCDDVTVETELPSHAPVWLDVHCPQCGHRWQKYMGKAYLGYGDDDD